MRVRAMATVALTAAAVSVLIAGGFAKAGFVTASESGSTTDAGTFGHDNTTKAYAAEYGVSLAEASRRLELQSTLDRPMQDMRELETGRFAGAWMEHEPEFRAVVAFTGNYEGLAAVEALAASSGPVVVRTGARFSLDQLVEGLIAIGPRLDSEFPEIASDADVREGAIRLIGPTDIPNETIAEFEAKAGIPVILEKAPREVALHTYGGRRLTVTGNDECTTGFGVRHIPSGDKGVLTAGHCLDNQVVYHQNANISYPLTWKGQFNDARHDAQWMRENNHGVFDDFWDGDSFQDVAAQVSKADSLGDFVCHWGIGSNLTVNPVGLSCGTVTSINYDPGNSCGDSGFGNCDPVWIRVQGANLACFFGDSGGPLFSGANAYGTFRGGSFTGTERGQCSSASFMSRDSLPEMNPCDPHELKGRSVVGVLLTGRCSSPA